MKLVPLIREYRSSDHDAALRICIAAFTPVHEGFREALGDELFGIEHSNWQAEYRKTFAKVGDGDGPDQVFVAEQDAQLVGFVFTHIDQSRKMGEIGLNAVDPDWQGKGIGRTLYARAIDHLKRIGAKAVYVGTGGDAAHAPARKAYEAVGFDRAIPSLHLYRLL